MRIVGVVLAITVATLGVAGLALVGQLENSLKKGAYNSFTQEVRKASKQHLSLYRKINIYAIGSLAQDPRSKIGRHARSELILANGLFQEQIGATLVTPVAFVDNSGHGIPVIPPGVVEDASSVPQAGVLQALRRHRTDYGFITIGNTQYVRAAIPILGAAIPISGSPDPVLVVTKAINEIPGAVHAVQQSLLIAALAGLVLTLLLAIPVSARLVRRLRNLHESALRLAADGSAPELPDDRSSDEIGDLTRTFALMQRRLRHQEEARRAFVSTASHELRTPLASLDLMLELLAEDLEAGKVDLEDAQELLARARSQSKRLGRLAADLLDLSRIDAEVQLRSEPVELGELCRAVIAEFELGTQERGVLCALRGAEDPLWAFGDPGSVARILRILLDNAVRVAPRGSEVVVELNTGPRPSLSVSDSGPGIPANERELIFERFKRGHGTGGEAGFGLGLAIGRELAQRMDGTLQLAESCGPGATFVLTLELAKAPAAIESDSVVAI
ncbi:MAG: ATP-binding protein [Solirubrobacteraceae bacterium]